MSEYFVCHKKEGYVIIELTVTNLDLFVASGILNQFKKIIEESGYPDVIFDLNKVEYLDSSGVGFLISAKNTVNKNKAKMIIACKNHTVLKVFKITKIEIFFEIYPTVADALKSGNKKK